MATVYLSLGSNKGRRPDNIKKAVRLLDECGLRVRDMSALYETAPVSNVAQRDFINACVRVETSFDPRKVLRAVQHIEQCMGRDRSRPKQKGYERPRIIDIDILLYDDITLNTRNLTIPHPRMHQRAFVLEPLADIAPDITEKLLKSRGQ